jgi:hypothetical protein
MGMVMHSRLELGIVGAGTIEKEIEMSQGPSQPIEMLS